MINASELPNQLAFDANSLNNLKVSAKENSPEAIKEVAKQFEAVFINMVIKSMRLATPQDGPFDSEQSRTFTAMLDQQLSSDIASKGVGLAEILTRQLSKVSNVDTDTMNQAVSGKTDPTNSTFIPSLLKSKSAFNTFIPSLLKSTGYQTVSNEVKSISPVAAIQAKIPSKLSGNSAEFHQRMSRYAEVASRETGMPANLMLGQAALESGWGRREIKASDGTLSHNLFGIKATGGWKGKVVETATTEYIDGIKQKRMEKFRAYDSYADSFKDFANLIQNNPRYKAVMANLNNVNGYANAMQQSGYATDPNYATKLASVINKVST